MAAKYQNVNENFMKTFELKEFYKSLSELNNSFTHYNFVWNQFNIDYLTEIEKSPDTLTEKYFTENLFKSKHNIKFSELILEHNKTSLTLTNGIFVLIFSHFESFLKNILNFAREIDETIPNFEDKKIEFTEDSTIFEKFINRVNFDKYLFAEEYIYTLHYLRLKRNKLIHSNSKNISGTVSQLINKNGNNLNKFWNELLASSLQGIDFSSKENFENLEFEIIIDSINILRKISEEINIRLIQKLGIENILRKIIIPNFEESHGKKISGFKIERKISKFESYCKSLYGIIISAEEIQIYKSSLA